MGRESLYSLLGVESTATIDEIKRAYRRLVMQYHPDSGKAGASHEIFQKVTSAYEVLVDATRRKEYDELNGFCKTTPEPDPKFERANKYLTEDGLRKGNFAVPSSLRLSGRYSREELESEEEGASSFISKIGEKYRSILKGDSTDEGTGEILSQLETDAYSSELEITALESILGTLKEIEVDENVSYRVRIASGVSDGDILGIPIRGGTFCFRIRIRSDGFVQREGNDIIVNVPITLGEALEGAELEIPTLTGPIKLKLPARWDVEKRLRLKGKGVRDREGNHGNLFVKPYIVLPFELTEDEVSNGKKFSYRHNGKVRGAFPQQLKYSR